MSSKSSLKKFVKQNSKHYSEQQLYIDAMSLLVNDILSNFNPNMCRDFKIEFGYEFIKWLQKFIKEFAKSFHYEDHDKKIEELNNIDDIILEINIQLNMLEKIKSNDTNNWMGISKAKLNEIIKNWGNILDHYDNYKNWIMKH